MPAEFCRQAGVTRDGKICYYGKKDSSDPTAPDLSLWVTVGKPRLDGDNEVRLSDVGLNEADHFRRAADLPLSEVLEFREKEIRELLSGLSSYKLRSKTIGKRSA